MVGATMTRSLEPAVDRDSRPPVGLLAAGAGLTVAGIYYNQPILHTIATELHASPAEVGYVPMLTQLGYAAGIVLFAPIGDRFERRGVILLKSIALILALVGAAVAPSIVALCAASLLIGLFATIAQDFVPAAAAMAPDASRGKVVGTVMTGLLLGILLSRFVSGTAASQFGWRLVFAGAAVSIAALAVVARARLPAFPPTASESYGALLLSMIKLARELPALRRAALAQALLSVAFSGFWSTLALELATPAYGLGSTAAGSFGLAGAAGALVAPLAGSFADKRSPDTVIRAGAALVIASFAMMATWQASLPVLIAGTIVFDLGVQSCLISHQTIIYGLAPSARSRVNAILVSTMFIGMAGGAAIASHAFARYGWTGVTLTGVIASTLALVVRLLPGGKRPPPRESAQPA